MSNVNRVADKRDFMSSFKKVVMMPVNALPVIPIYSPFAAMTGGKQASRQSVISDGSGLGGGLAPANADSQPPSRSLSPVPGYSGGLTHQMGSSAGGSNVSNVSATSFSGKDGIAPTSELAAKAAIMNTKLEGIQSLFSIEVALSLTHSAKASLERAALFVRMGGQIGEEAKEQCEIIFVTLLKILGYRHIQVGFDKAVDRLAAYNPREVSGDEHSQPGVAPLVMFLELVNVGDLIQQMIDVFYEQELIATKLTDRNDFLDAAVKEKKKFEQMLDERVAAGLNKGIDVLMDEVEYVFGTLQKPTDFNPGAVSIDGKEDPRASVQSFDIGTSKAAIKVVEIVSGHTRMLVGSTDKNVLDVFNQEVGIRLFTALCKHLKRQRVSVDGSFKLIS
jgi:recyclin-1